MAYKSYSNTNSIYSGALILAKNYRTGEGRFLESMNVASATSAHELHLWSTDTCSRMIHNILKSSTLITIRKRLKQPQINLKLKIGEKFTNHS